MIQNDHCQSSKGKLTDFTYSARHNISEIPPSAHSPHVAEAKRAGHQKWLAMDNCMYIEQQGQIWATQIDVIMLYQYSNIRNQIYLHTLRL
jgi:hypothetical protein